MKRYSIYHHTANRSVFLCLTRPCVIHLHHVIAIFLYVFARSPPQADDVAICTGDFHKIKRAAVYRLDVENNVRAMT